ncbi:putative leader peptide [Streptomyces marincola]|uniref:putative leader peptide n=1 Tax=Streptomyces marincola TaxID=2878388 RepID=UPI0029906A05|nr:putative leader peptide [Streptomyces marincola]
MADAGREAGCPAPSCPAGPLRPLPFLRAAAHRTARPRPRLLTSRRHIDLLRVSSAASRLP